MTESNKKSTEYYTGVGVALGVAIGAGLGAALDNIGAGVVVGGENNDTVSTTVAIHEPGTYYVAAFEDGFAEGIQPVNVWFEAVAPLTQVPARASLHDQIGAPGRSEARIREPPEVVDPHDVRVVQPGHHRNLVLERVRRLCPVHDLDRHVTGLAQPIG